MSIINLAAKVESSDLRFTQDGKAVLSLRLLMPQLENGQTVYRPLTATAWEERAQTLHQQIQQGSTMILKGVPQIDEYQPQGSTHKKRTFNIALDEVQPCPEGMIWNSISVAGRLGGIWDLKYFESAKVKGSNSLAVYRSKEQTDWFTLEIWAEQAERMANYTGKGSSLCVEGRLQIDFWVDRNTGENRYRPIVVVQRFTLTGSKPVNAESNGHNLNPPALATTGTGKSGYDEPPF